MAVKRPIGRLKWAEASRAAAHARVRNVIYIEHIAYMVCVDSYLHKSKYLVLTRARARGELGVGVGVEVGVEVSEVRENSCELLLHSMQSCEML